MTPEMERVLTAALADEGLLKRLREDAYRREERRQRSLGVPYERVDHIECARAANAYDPTVLIRSASTA